MKKLFALIAIVALLATGYVVAQSVSLSVNLTVSGAQFSAFQKELAQSNAARVSAGNSAQNGQQFFQAYVNDWLNSLVTKWDADEAAQIRELWLKADAAKRASAVQALQ